MTLKTMAKEMWACAEQNVLDVQKLDLSKRESYYAPLTRDFSHRGFEFRVIFSREKLDKRLIWHLSVGSFLEQRKIQNAIVMEIVAAFLDDPMEMPSAIQGREVRHFIRIDIGKP